MITQFNLFETVYPAFTEQVLCVMSLFIVDECELRYTEGTQYTSDVYYHNGTKYRMIIDDGGKKIPMHEHQKLNNLFYVKSSATHQYIAYFTKDKSMEEYKKRISQERFDL